jgi:hypothetical protein
VLGYMGNNRPRQNENILRIRFLSSAFTLKARKTTTKLGTTTWI